MEVNTESPNWSKGKESVTVGCLVRNETSTSHPSPEVKDHRGKGGEKLYKPGVMEIQSKTVLWLWQDNFTHQLTALRVPCTEPAHEQAGQWCRMEWAGFMSSLWLSDGSWGRVRFFFKCLAPHAEEYKQH